MVLERPHTEKAETRLPCSRPSQVHTAHANNLPNSRRANPEKRQAGTFPGHPYSAEKSALRYDRFFRQSDSLWQSPICCLGFFVYAALACVWTAPSHHMMGKYLCSTPQNPLSRQCLQVRAVGQGDLCSCSISPHFCDSSCFLYTLRQNLLSSLASPFGAGMGIGEG